MALAGVVVDRAGSAAAFGTASLAVGAAALVAVGAQWWWRAVPGVDPIPGRGRAGQNR
jgi:hypothetical protein